MLSRRVAFHSFAWPRNVKEVKGIVRTLLINHCNWADVLVVRGRRFSSNKVCFRANRVLDNLLWNWSKMRRPYVVYREGNEGIGDGVFVPAWFTHACVHRDFCRCHLVGSRPQGWHHPGALYSNVVSRLHQLFERRCGCSHVHLPYPIGSNANTITQNKTNKNNKNAEIAVKLSTVFVHVLTDVPPVVPKRGEPLVSILRSREIKPKWERERLGELRRRRARRVRGGEGSEGNSEDDDGEPFEEESIASRTR